MTSAEQDSTVEDRTEATVEITQEATGSSMTSSSSRGFGFYFQCVVLIVGVVGVAANGLVLYGLVASKQHKKHLLIFNQNALDFVNCLFLAVTYLVIFCNINLSGTGGYLLCMILLSGAGSLGALVGSLINLAAISIERYLKVVHHVWAKNKLRNWMIYSAIAFAWITGYLLAAAELIPTTAVVNGICYSRVFFKSEAAMMVFGVYDFLSRYVIILVIFIVCYGRILMVIRRQAQVMAVHSGQGSNTAQSQSNKIQTNVIKTMILVSGLFAVTWAPLSILSLVATFHYELAIGEVGVHTILSVAYFYICANPFIYATKFDPVRRVLLRLITCKKITQPLESVDNT